MFKQQLLTWVIVVSMQCGATKSLPGSVVCTIRAYVGDAWQQPGLTSAASVKALTQAAQKKWRMEMDLIVEKYVQRFVFRYVYPLASEAKELLPMTACDAEVVREIEKFPPAARNRAGFTILLEKFEELGYDIEGYSDVANTISLSWTS